MVSIDIDNRQKKMEIDEEIRDIVIQSCEEVLKYEFIDKAVEVSVSFVEPEEIQSLNLQFRHIDSVTDVLSFPMEEDFFGVGILLGDIVINTERIISQAKEYGHSEKRELSYLTVHSMLHLLGYDHMEEKDKVIMRNKEKEIMNSLEIYRE